MIHFRLIRRCHDHAPVRLHVDADHSTRSAIDALLNGEIALAKARLPLALAKLPLRIPAVGESLAALARAGRTGGLHLRDVELGLSMATVDWSRHLGDSEWWRLERAGCTFTALNFGVATACFSVVRQTPARKVEIQDILLGAPRAAGSGDGRSLRSALALARAMGLTLVAGELPSHAQVYRVQALGCVEYVSSERLGRGAA